MMIIENYIVTAPNRKDINEVLSWLKAEKSKYGSSFYCNKNIIDKSFKLGQTIVFKCGNQNIGLLVWSAPDEILVNIDIFVIHPSSRGKGYGEFYYKVVSDYFKDKGFKVVKLFCSPEKSEGFWKRMGLVEFPNCGYTEHKLTYYGVLVDVASNTYIANTDKIELWDVEPYESIEKQPRWTWYIEVCEDKLLYPIVQPCNCNWNLRWSRNGIILKESKVKYFTDEDYELWPSKILYIDKTYHFLSI